jgi:hypothetical protein
MIFVIASEAKQSPSLQASPRIAVDTEHLLTVFNKCGRGTRKTTHLAAADTGAQSRHIDIKLSMG